jgi:hypothetical protein
MSCPGCALCPGKGPPSTHWIGGWVGPRAGLNVGTRRKILCSCQELNPDSPARSQTLYCLSYCGSPIILLYYNKCVSGWWWGNVFVKLRKKDWQGVFLCVCQPNIFLMTYVVNTSRHSLVLLPPAWFHLEPAQSLKIYKLWVCHMIKILFAVSQSAFHWSVSLSS